MSELIICQASLTLMVFLTEPRRNLRRSLDEFVDVEKLGTGCTATVDVENANVVSVLSRLIILL